MWFKCWLYILNKLRMRKKHLIVGMIACLILTLFLYSTPSRHRETKLENQHPNFLGKDEYPNHLFENEVKDDNMFFKLHERKNKDTKLVDNVVNFVKPTPLTLSKVSSKLLESHLESISVIKHSAQSELSIIPTNETQFYEYPLKVSMDEVTAILRNQLSFQALEESVERTRTYLVAHQPEFDINSGACECNRISDPCICCITVQPAKQFKIIQGKVCLNFTYLPVKQALLVNMTMDQHLLFESLINIKTPPQLCAGSRNSSGGVYICCHLRYLSYGVEMQEEHKTRFSGCADILVKLQLRDIAILPLGCFKAPKSDSKNVLHDKIAAVVN